MKPPRKAKRSSAGVLSELTHWVGRLGDVSLDDVDAAIEETEARTNVLRQVRAIVEAARGKVEAVPLGVRVAVPKCVPALGPSPLTDRPVRDGEWVNPRRLAIAKYLAAHGRQRISVLCRSLGIPTGSIHYLLNYKGWFQQAFDGTYELTPTGRTMAADHGLVVGDNRQRVARQRNEQNAVLELRALGAKLEAKL